MSCGPPATILVPQGQANDALLNNVWRSAVGMPMGPPPGWMGGSSRTGSFGEPGPYFNKPYQYYQMHFFQAVSDQLEQWSKHWLGYSSYDGVALSGALLDAAPRDVQTALWQYVECGGTLLVLGQAKLPESWERARGTTSTFADYSPGFGRCLMTAKSPDKWNPDEWRLVTGMWERSLGAWQQVRSPTDANKEFEIVQGLAIPVRGLFVAMVLFVVVIGPVNVAWLSRWKRRIWLLWTVPVFSLLTCAVLVGYMIATEGWYGYVRAEGITVLDETSQRAATIGWLGYYCPTTPAGGLRFGMETELTPHLNIRGGPYRGHQAYAVDWSNGQHLYEGWITAKVPIHFLVRNNEKRAERITVRKSDDGSLALVNSLGADIKTIWLAGANGRIHTASDVRAGPEVKLQSTDQEAGGKMNKLNEAFGGTWTRWAEYMIDHPAEYLRPGCYLAVLEDAPFLEQGLRRTQSRRLRSVVFGIMKEIP